MIRCIKYRPYQKNTLKGFVDIELTRVGIVLHDCHEKADKEWIGFPARSYQDKTGNTQWQALIEFADGAWEARRQFQRQAIEAIHSFAGEQDSGAGS